MADKTIKFQYTFDGVTRNGEVEYDEGDWLDMDNEERAEVLRDALSEDFADNVEIVGESINDEG